MQPKRDESGCSSCLGLCALALVSLLFVTLLLQIPTGAAFELPEPDHGVGEDFGKLWSKYQNSTPQGGSAVNELASSTDYIYIEPPSAPDRWTRGEVNEFTGGDEDASLHPTDARLVDSRNGTVKDAYVSFFAAEPSTWYPDLVPVEGDRRGGGRDSGGGNGNLLAPAQGGEIHGFVDYRVQGVDSHEVTVYVYDSQTTDLSDVLRGSGGAIWRGTLSDSGSFTAPYGSLGSGSLNITAVVKTERTVSGGTETDRAVATDNVELTPYDMDDQRGAPSALGRLGVYPDGDTALFLGFVVQPTGGWSSVTLSDGSVLHSNWRFFSARDTDWDTMLKSTAGGTSEANESYHPLLVHAYPSRSGTYVNGGAEMSVAGPRYERPALPDGVNLGIPNSTYRLPQQLDTRYRTASQGGDTTIGGLVAGTSSEPRIAPRITEIRGTNLRVGVVEERENSVEVAVSLRDGDGQPIDTRGGEDYIRIEGHGNVTTGLDGSGTTNVSPKPTAVFGEYVPEAWHEVGEGQPAYLADSDTAMVENDFDLIGELGSLTQFFVIALPFLLMVYFMDKILGLGIWPPWKRI